ncbi:hypothetical protein V6N13_083489 [Hibiscus sabdariffa]
MHPSLLSHFFGVETSVEIWQMLVEYFSSRSTTTVISLHFKLRSLQKKGDMSMRMYISKVKEAQQAIFNQEFLVPMSAHNVQFAGNSTNDSQSKATWSQSGNTGRERSRNHFQCQLYGKLGHLVDRCYHRFDKSYASVIVSGFKSNATDESPSALVCSTAHVASLVTTTDSLFSMSWVFYFQPE